MSLSTVLKNCLHVTQNSLPQHVTVIMCLLSCCYKSDTFIIMMSLPVCHCQHHLLLLAHHSQHIILSTSRSAHHPQHITFSTSPSVHHSKHITFSASPSIHHLQHVILSAYNQKTLRTSASVRQHHHPHSIKLSASPSENHYYR